MHGHLQIKPESRIIRLLAILVFLTIVIASVTAEEPHRIIPASEVLEELDKGLPVEYDNVIIDGDLDIDKLNLPIEEVERTRPLISKADNGVPIMALPGQTEKVLQKVKIISSPIKIKSSILNGTLSLSNSILSKSVSFESTRFVKFADFGWTEFRNISSFHSSRFISGANFENAKFFNEIDFEGTEFDGKANYDNAMFKGYSPFTWAKFKTDALFDYASFLDVVFIGADFNKWASFQGAKFNLGYFQQANFKGASVFDEAKFNGYAEFSGAKFEDVVSFSRSEFNGEVLFIDVDFVKDASFDGCKFDRNLNLLRLKFSRLIIDWDSIKNGLIADGPVYLALIKNFKDLEQSDDADNCFYQYRKWKQDQKGLGWSKLLDMIAWQSCGYGVRPSHALTWSFVIIFLFGIFFWIGNSIYKSSTLEDMPTIATNRTIYEYLNHLISETFKILANISLIRLINLARSVPKSAPKLRPGSIGQILTSISRRSFTVELSFKDTLYFSTMAFISRPPQYWLPRGNWRYLVMAEGILGWLFLALFIVTLVNVMIRY